MPRIIPPLKVIKAIGHLSKTATVVGATILPPKRSPDQQLGELFSDVQMSRVNEDGKTFVDAIPNQAGRKILKAYKSAREDPDFDLKKFVHEHFTDITDAAGYHSDARHTPYTHIKKLWSVLTHQAPRNSGSLLALPHPYVVPGGRFQEQFYWDTYFIMLGLDASKLYDLIDGMMKN